jgi:hypothetical protein
MAKRRGGSSRSARLAELQVRVYDRAAADWKAAEGVNER